MRILQLYNTRTRRLEVFKPLVSKKVTIYVCGITPYDTTHLGHAFTYISFDALIRYLEYLGYKVSYTQNVTDINDRDTDILMRAKEQNIAWNKLAQFWTERFLDNMKALNWRMPDYYLKASEHIQTIVLLIQKLLKNGFAYKEKGDVFLDVKKISNYGSLSQLGEKEMLTAAKQFEEDLENPLKRNKLDITLWKAKEPNQPSHIPIFNSPFGKGRPGWHIECSAMSIYSLGEQIDIHAGGADLIFPHHEAEIAQSEGATGKKPFANFWIHNASVLYQGSKMSKSLGNLVLISDLLKIYSKNAIRFLLLSHHFRKPWEYKKNKMENARKQIITIEKYLQVRKESVQDNTKIIKIFNEYLSDNLNISGYFRWVLQNLPNLSEDERVTVGTTFTTLGFTPHHF